MPFAPNTIIADRYQLLESLGSGAMGEVWKAQDRRFESRTVAIKLLREDETLRDDARNRDKFLQTLEQESRSGRLTPALVINALDDALVVGSNREALVLRVAPHLTGGRTLTTDDGLRLFDELVNDSAFNENARLRAKMRKLFRDEANSVANLRHDNVVNISDYGEHDGLPYLVMDFIEGRTLHRVIQRAERLSRPRQLRLMEDLCNGLAYAHRKNLVHRDIKPANLIIDGSTERLKILDFGVVRRLQHSGDSTVGIPIGTFCYMSPEQTRGSATLDHRSDIFSVGTVFYELLTGRKAFPPAGTITELILRVQKEQPRPIREIVPDIEDGIEPIVYKALEKRPDRRYQDLAAMEKEIARVRLRLEREAEHSEGTRVVNRSDETVVIDSDSGLKPQNLLRRARSAFTSGDDRAAIELCRQILQMDAQSAEAQELLRRAEARQAEQAAREASERRRAQQAAEEKARAQAAEAQRALEQQERKEAEADADADAALAHAEQMVAAGLVAAAINHLDSLGSPVARVRQRADALRQELRRQQQDAAGAAARDAEKRERQTRGAALLMEAATARGAQNWDAALEHVNAARKLLPDDREVDIAYNTIIADATAARAPHEPAVHDAVLGPDPAEQHRRRLLLAVAAAVAVVLLVVGYFIVSAIRGSREQPAASVSNQAQQPPAPQASSSTPPASTPPPGPTAAPASDPAAAPAVVPPLPPSPPPAAGMATLTVDLQPWARVRIVPAAARGDVPARSEMTPFSIDLPAGEYTLEAENGGVTRAETIEVTLVEGKPFVLNRRLPGFDADRVVSALLAQER